ncbi:MAG: SAM-dependent methyltransferase [Planctomycetota bacterium]|jgi:SAM-dependent methyltransferase
MNSDEHDAEYILGTHEDEAFRLGLQHSLWTEHAHRIWKRARIGFGSRVIDAGCGPGFATLDLSRLVGSVGHVTALEASPVFVESLKETLAKQGVPGIDSSNISVQQADLQDVSLEPESHDAAYLRWVLCFIPDVLAALKNLSTALKPGGRIAIQDYANFRGSLTLFPRSEAFEELATTFHDGWMASGGNSRIGIELPSLLRQAGFEVEDVKLMSFAVRPQDSLWRWPESFFPIVAKSLVEKGKLAESTRQEYLSDWRSRSQSKDSLFCTPSIIEVIGRKL